MKIAIPCASPAKQQSWLIMLWGLQEKLKCNARTTCHKLSMQLSLPLSFSRIQYESFLSINDIFQELMWKHTWKKVTTDFRWQKNKQPSTHLFFSRKTVSKGRRMWRNASSNYNFSFIQIHSWAPVSIISHSIPTFKRLAFVAISYFLNSICHLIVLDKKYIDIFLQPQRKT